MIVGATLLPMPLEAAIVQSINALMVYEQTMILMRSMPAVAIDYYFSTRKSAVAHWSAYYK